MSVLVLYADENDSNKVAWIQGAVGERIQFTNANAPYAIDQASLGNIAAHYDILIFITHGKTYKSKGRMSAKDGIKTDGTKIEGGRVTNDSIGETIKLFTPHIVQFFGCGIAKGNTLYDLYNAASELADQTIFLAGSAVGSNMLVKNMTPHKTLYGDAFYGKLQGKEAKAYARSGLVDKELREQYGATDLSQIVW